MLPWLLTAVLFLLALIQTARVFFLRRSFDELADELDLCLSDETNVLLSTSSADRHVRRFADRLNRELKTLRSLRQSYRSGDEVLKTSVTNVAHDLRTPLTAIRGYLDLMGREELSDSAARYLGIIRERVGLMGELTEELFRWSAARQGEPERKPEEVSVGEVLEESLAAFYSTLTEHGIEPEIEIPENKVIRMTDRFALSRVFANLLQNAVRYSDGDLKVTLAESGEIVFSNRAAGLGEVGVMRLFDRYYTVDSARKTTGLGLSITQELVEGMGGTVEAAYSDGRLVITVRI